MWTCMDILAVPTCWTRLYWWNSCSFYSLSNVYIYIYIHVCANFEKYSIYHMRSKMHTSLISVGMIMIVILNCFLHRLMMWPVVNIIMNGTELYHLSGA